MPLDGFGLQFQPGTAQQGANSPQRGRVQEPIQMLSTRLPKIFGAGAIAPGALLQGAGGMGMPAAQGNVVAQALAQLAGLPPGMMPSAGLGPGVLPPMLPSAPFDRSSGLPGLPTKQPQSPGGYGDWMGHERALGGQSQLPTPQISAPQGMFQPPPPRQVSAPQPPPPIPIPHVSFSQPPGVGVGPTNPPLPPPFQPPIFPTPPAPNGQDLLALLDHVRSGGALTRMADY